MTDNKSVLCAICRVAVHTTPDPAPQDPVTCPVCGATDTFENVQRSMGEQAQEYAARKLQETMQNVARGSQFLKYTPGTIPKRNHRFVVDFR